MVCTQAQQGFQPAVLSYTVVATFPHNTDAFTEGLIAETCEPAGQACNASLWESTRMLVCMACILLTV